MEINYGNVFSGEKEDRIDDINLELMRNMDDITLSNFCKTSPYYRNLCENTVWLERIKAVPGLSLLLPYRSHYKSLEDFYFNVRNDTQYVVTIIIVPARRTRIRAPPEIYVTNDIQKAYAYAIKYLSSLVPVETRTGRTDEELLRLMEEIVHLTIMIRFDDAIDYDRLNDYTIYSTTKGVPGYFNPNIMFYPLLNPRVIYAAIRHDVKGQRSLLSYFGDFSFVKYNIESLHQVHKMNLNMNLFFKSKDDDLVANSRRTLGWMLYGFFNIESTFLMDFDMLGLSPPGYHWIINNGIRSRIDDDFDSYQILAMTPEQFQQKVHDAMLSAVQTGQIIPPDQVLSTLRSYH
jgi:hypothetical protein